MYESHFNLRRTPFGRTLKPDQLFRSAAREQARRRILHLLELRGVGVVTGEAGVGKTTLCRQIADELHDGLYRVRYVSMSTGSVIDTLNAVAASFGLAGGVSRAGVFGAIKAEVARMVQETRLTPVLIFDEAHHLGNDVLAELKLLTNYAMDSENRLCMLLVGLTGLRLRLRMSAHQPLAQRVFVNCHLTGLGEDEVGPYLEHRMQLAGARNPIFEPPAVEALRLAGGRIPRLIDLIAHHALIAAAEDKSDTVAVRHVEAASSEALL